MNFTHMRHNVTSYVPNSPFWKILEQVVDYGISKKELFFLSGVKIILLKSFDSSKLLRLCMYRDADKSLARPGRKQATATEDFEFHISYLLS